MLVTLMKTAQQVNNKIFVFLFQLCITENNCLNIIDCQPNTCVRGNCTFQINGYVRIFITGYIEKKKKRQKTIPQVNHEIFVLFYSVIIQ